MDLLHAASIEQQSRRSLRLRDGGLSIFAIGVGATLGIDSFILAFLVGGILLATGVWLLFEASQD